MIKIFFKYLLLLLLVTTLVWTVYFFYNKSHKPPEVVKTQSPTVTTIIQKTVATGAVIPRKEIFMKSKVSGIIEKVMVLAGDHIKAGDVIAQVKIIPNMVEMNNAESRVNQAKINNDNAKIDFDRNTPLMKEGVITKTEMQQYELRLRTTSEELESAQNNLLLIKEGVTKRSGEATNTLIRSTISGMVLDVPVKEGNSVIESNTFNEGTTIASVADMGEMIFDGKVDESEVGKIKTGMNLVLTVGAIENEKFEALLEYISPKGVTENGAIQFEVKASIKNKPGQFLRAGYSANADIILATKDSVLGIPEAALQFSHDSSFVEVETTPGKFVKRYIKTGISDGITIEVKEGLQKTDKFKMPELKEDAPKS